MVDLQATYDETDSKAETMDIRSTILENVVASRRKIVLQEICTLEI